MIRAIRFYLSKGLTPEEILANLKFLYKQKNGTATTIKLEEVNEAIENIKKYNLDPSVFDKYIFAKNEVKRVEGELDRLREKKKWDTVKGSDPEYPYCEHIIIIEGYDSDYKQKAELLTDKLIELRQITYAVECFISSVDNLVDRKILELRYFEGKKWKDIASDISLALEKDMSENAVWLRANKLLKS